MKQQVIELVRQSRDLQTPAFVVDEQQMLADAAMATHAVAGSNAQLLFAMKSFSILPALQSLANVVDGFHASSLFEAKLARQILGDKSVIHVTTPGMRPDEYDELNQLCDYISFNSLSQWQAFLNITQPKPRCGLRVNPQLSLIKDPRYDPCRRSSKLGVPLQQLKALVENNMEQLKGISRLLLHSNCDATDYSGLVDTIQHLSVNLQPLLEKLEWINLGGGYLFNDAPHGDALKEVIARLQDRYDLQLLFEPGAAICRKAGYFVSTVLDIFDSDESRVAVLDTTVNHMPEIFEYQFEPDIVDDISEGNNKYILAGSTCLAGDLFGDYSFKQALQIGSRVVFENAGAYTMVKANMFNGINLPTIYILKLDGSLSLVKQYDYNDYLTLCGAD